MLRSIRQPVLAVAFVGTLVAVPALAQQPASYPPACDASKVSKGDVDRAHTVFLSGKQFLDESNYDKAISYFNDAYSIDCSVHGILPIIATAYERKGDKGEAVRALEEYLRRVPSSPEREHIERRIKNLNDQLAREPAPPAPTSSASNTPPPAPAPVPTVETVASASPAPPPAPADVPPAPSGGRGIGPWVLAGVGGAATIGGVVMYIVGSGDISSAEKACHGRMDCTPLVASQGNSGRTLETVGAIVGGVGVAGLGAGLIWFLLEKPATPPTSGVFVGPVLTPSYVGLTVNSRL